MELKKVSLPSGAELSFNIAPHAESKRLFMAVMRELQKIGVTPGEFGAEMLVKDIACIILSSDALDEAIKPCLARCLYDSEKVGPETFEAAERRQDYLPVVIAVVQENIAPFLNGLFSQLRGYSELLGTLGIQLFKSGTTSAETMKTS